MTLAVFPVLRREGCTGSCCNFLLAFHGEGFASPWRVIGDATFIQYFYFLQCCSFEEGAGRAPKRRRYFKFYLYKWWWIIKTKEDEKKEKKEGVLKGCLFFPFLLFCLFTKDFFLMVILVQI